MPRAWPDEAAAAGQVGGDWVRRVAGPPDRGHGGAAVRPGGRVAGGDGRQPTGGAHRATGGACPGVAGYKGMQTVFHTAVEAAYAKAPCLSL